ncbi:MAG: glycosyltransferase family 4 protein [bacterium]|nr:glycosyltransferase family 4 protein [bacterium]
MKTLLFTLEYPPFHGGVANYYGGLVKYWPEAGEIQVLNNNRGELLNNLPLGWLKAIVKLRQVIKTEKINHVLVGQILPLGTATLICSKFCKIKYSVFLHGLDFTYAAKLSKKKFISSLILTGAEKIICANNYVAKIASQKFPKIEHKIIVVNPGVENLVGHNPQLITQLKAKYNLNNKIVLLSVGRLIRRKGFGKVIKAMPKIFKSAPNLVYFIIGDGPEIEKWKMKIKNFGLEKNVKIINQATDEERDSWYGASDIFIMPARNINGDFEGFGIVYLEANLAGKPVIAGRSGGVEDAVIDGLNGLLVDPENLEQIASAVIKLANNPELRKKLGEQGRERAIKNFNWQKQAEKIYKIIKPL